jgi:hypothetical protein
MTFYSINVQPTQKLLEDELKKALIFHVITLIDSAVNLKPVFYINQKYLVVQVKMFLYAKHSQVFRKIQWRLSTKTNCFD